MNLWRTDVIYPLVKGSKLFDQEYPSSIGSIMDRMLRGPGEVRAYLFYSDGPERYHWKLFSGFDRIAQGPGGRDALNEELKHWGIDLIPAPTQKYADRRKTE